MKGKIVWVLLSCLMVAALVLASCGPAAVEEEEGKTITGKVVEKEAPKEKEKEEVVVTPKKEGPFYGGTITICRGAAIVAFDVGFGFPWVTQGLSYTNEELFGGDWGQGLSGSGDCSWQSYGFSGLTCHTPRLCESWELIEPSTLVYHIRKGVHWHNKPPVNGRELDAHDVVYTMERGLRLPRSYLNITMTQAERPTSIEATDKWTVRVVCAEGKAGKWLEQSGELMVIIPPEVDEEWGDMNDWKHVIGTGPFTIIDYVPMSALTLERNPNYWMNDPVHPENRLPYVDYVKLHIIEDASTRIAALRTAKLDTLRLGYDDAEDVMATTTDLVWSEVANTAPSLVFMNLEKEPWSDIRVRRALQIGVDQKEISDSFYSGHSEWYSFPILPMAEHSDMWISLEEMPESVQELFGYDPDKAKALLAEAGYPNGFKATVVCYQAYVDMLSIFKDYWSKIGVELELDVKEYTVWNSQIASKSYDDMIVRGLSGSSTSHKLYTYRGGREGPVENLSFIDCPRCDETYTKMLDNYFQPEVRRGLFKELVPYILDQVWMIQMPTAHLFTGWWPWLKGYSGEIVVGYYDIDNWPAYCWVDQDLKAEMQGK